MNLPDKERSVAVNCLALPGVLIGETNFSTKGVEEKLKNMQIEHVITPTTQFNKYSAESIHCLTNELLWE